MTKIKKITLELERKTNQLGFFIKIPVEIEQLFQRESPAQIPAVEEQPAASAYWIDHEKKGIQFYKVTDNYRRKCKELIRDCYDDFGDSDKEFLDDEGLDEEDSPEV